MRVKVHAHRGQQKMHGDAVVRFGVHLLSLFILLYSNKARVEN